MRYIGCRAQLCHNAYDRVKQNKKQKTKNFYKNKNENFYKNGIINITLGFVIPVHGPGFLAISGCNVAAQRRFFLFGQSYGYNPCIV